MEFFASWPWAGIGFVGSALMMVGMFSLGWKAPDQHNQNMAMLISVICFIAMCFFGMNL